MVNVVSLGGCLLETGTGGKTGCEEKRGVKGHDSRVFGLNSWVLTGGMQICGVEI